MASIFLIRFVVGILLTSVQIDINPPIVTTVGKKSTELKCTLIKENEYIYSISIEAYNKSMAVYNVIATFYPSDARPPLLSSHGQYLEDRVSLITNASIEASILFHQVRCEDDNKYICLVNFDKNGVPMTQVSSTTTLTVKSLPEKPEDIATVSDINQSESGQLVTFICKGNTGKPPRKLIWKKYLHNTQIPIVYSDVNTTFIYVSYNCTFYGTSVFTIQLAVMDNNAVISCVTNTSETMELSTKPITVYYPVNDVTIHRHTEKTDSNHNVNLNCSATGNPAPNFKWYRETDKSHILSENSLLTIDGLSFNESGFYVCTAFNSFNNKFYSESTKISVYVEEHAITEIDDVKTHTEAIIGSVVGAVIFILVTTFLSVIVCRKQRGSCVAKTTSNYDGLDVSQNTSHSKYDTIHHQSTEDHTGSAELHQYCNNGTALRKDDPTYDNEQNHVNNSRVISREDTNESSYEIVGDGRERKDH